MFRCWLSAASIGPPPGGAALVGSPAGGPEGVSGPLGSGMVGSSAIDVPRGRATRKLPLDCTSMQHEATQCITSAHVPRHRPYALATEAHRGSVPSDPVPERPWPVPSCDL